MSEKNHPPCLLNCFSISVLLFVILVGVVSQYDDYTIVVEETTTEFRAQENDGSDDALDLVNARFNSFSAVRTNHCPYSFCIDNFRNNIVLLPDSRAPPHFS